MMIIRFINNISPGTIEILSRKIDDKRVKELIAQNNVSALGLCQGDIAEMIVASDIAEKSSNVIVGEITGNCPQHFVCLGIFGDTASVKNALGALEKELVKKK